MIETLVLAGVAADSIAERLGLTPAVIEVYEEALFAIRPRLTQRDCVLFAAIDPDGGLARGSPSTEAIARLLAYHGGFAVADAVLALARAGGDIDPEMARRLGLLVELFGLAITPRTAPLLLRTSLLRAEVERRRAARRVAVVTRPIFTVDFGAQDHSNGSNLGARVRANCAPEGPSAGATQRSETASPSSAASDSPAVRPGPARRTA